MLGKDQDNYLKTYRKYISNPSKKLFEPKSDTDSDDENKKEKEDEHISGITHYNELKKRPHFLKYTIDRLKAKEISEIEKQKSKMETIENIKSSMRTISLENKDSSTARTKLLEK